MREAAPRDQWRWLRPMKRLAPWRYMLPATVVFVGAGAASIVALDAGWFPPVFFGLYCGQVVAEGLWWRVNRLRHSGVMAAAAVCAFVVVLVIDLAPLVEDVDGVREIAFALLVPAWPFRA